MHIIIAGAGEVGSHLAEMLANEAQDIYIIDQDSKRLANIRSHLDVYIIEGDAKSAKVLESAKVGSCDLLVAVTSSEEINFFVSVLGKKMGAQKTIMRFNNMELKELQKENLFTELGIDIIVSPVELVAHEITRLIKQTAFTDDIEFENGKLIVFGLSAEEHSPLIGKPIGSIFDKECDGDIKPIAIHRKDDTFILNSNTSIYLHDIIYFISKKESLETAMRICHKEITPVRDIMILGASRIGILTAELLQDTYRVVMVDKNMNKCNKIAGQLKNTLVLNIDGRDVASLEEEGLDQTDAFIAVTGDSETNIMSSLVAKSHGVSKTICRVENMDYIPLSQTVGIDTLINKKMIAAASIFKHVRKGKVEAVANLHGVDAEIIEFDVMPDSKVTQKPIGRLSFPERAKIIGVIREEKVVIPDNYFLIKDYDKVIVFVLSDCIALVEKFFQ